VGSVPASAGNLRKSFYKQVKNLPKLTPLTIIFPRVIEMQIIAVALLENFEFSLPPQNEKTRIYRKPSRPMTPMIEGNPGAWMGLVIKSVE
jgi:hypothetical protein